MATATSAASIGQHLPWVDTTLDYTDRLVALIPEEQLDYRPVDPQGGHMFSLAEYAMHLADERRELARMLAGSDSREHFWTLENWETGGAGTPWQFRPWGTKAELLDSLRAGREELAPWLNLPLSELQQPTAGTRAIHEQHLAKMRGAGEDAERFAQAGPPTINRVLFALTLHESGHRGSMQTVMRLCGIDARGEH